ncbi:MAG: hypothetical protein ACLFTJ_10145 [Halothece sp.]
MWKTPLKLTGKHQANIGGCALNWVLAATETVARRSFPHDWSLAEAQPELEVFDQSLMPIN